MIPELFNCIMYALISGFTAFLPVSASAHQLLFSHLTGFLGDDPMLHLSIRLGALVTLLLCSWKKLKRLHRQNELARLSRRRRKHHPDVAMLLDIRLLRMSVVPSLIGAFLNWYLSGVKLGIHFWVLLTLLSGAFLALPRITGQGNRDARSLSLLDGLLIGLGNVLGAVPGFSGIGGMTVIGQIRGADRGYILDTALTLSVPALLVLLAFDIYAVATAEIFFGVLMLLSYALAAVVSGIAAYFSITLMRYLSVKIGFNSFAYYSAGLALMFFILYLTF